MKQPSNPLARAVLRVGSAIYGAAVRARNRHYDRPGAGLRAGIPVVSVGNVTVGGTGKTPMVAWLVRKLLASGRRPAVVSRGYRGTAGRGPCVVSEGSGPSCGPELCGDEPFLLARSLAGASVVVGSDRHAGAVEAARLGCDVVVLDDGFQHRRLARDLDVVLVDSDHPFGNGLLLPAGPLREPLEGLSRADVLVLTRSGPDERHPAIEELLRRHAPRAPVLRAGNRILGLFDGDDRRLEAPSRAVGFCGIGSPDRFRRDLSAQGVEIVAFRAFRDHHEFSGSELRELCDEASRNDAILVTTDKDRARLQRRDAATALPDLLTLRITTELYDPGPLLEALERALAGGFR